MKKKIFIIFIASLLITSVIYAVFKNDKIVITALGDSIAKGISPYGGESYSYTDYVNEYLENKNEVKKYYRNFTGKDYRTNDIINMIKNNETKMYNGKKVTIQQALVKSDIITISVGNYDLFNHLNITNGGLPVKSKHELNEYFLSMFSDINNLIKTIQKFSSAKIVLIGFYNPQIAPTEETTNIFEYIDDSYRLIAEKNNCYYISIHHEISGNEEYIPNYDNIHFNYKGHKLISDKIIKTLKL